MRVSHDGVLFISVRSNGCEELGVPGEEGAVQLVVPSCGASVRGRLVFVVAELGSVWCELKNHHRRRPAPNPSGGGC